tara:strand:+ start:4652 stop:5554 length:903 start_codon:yes stop_codon:yes gene_type:complete
MDGMMIMLLSTTIFPTINISIPITGWSDYRSSIFFKHYMMCLFELGLSIRSTQIDPSTSVEEHHISNANDIYNSNTHALLPSESLAWEVSNVEALYHNSYLSTTSRSAEQMNNIANVGYTNNDFKSWWDDLDTNKTMIPTKTDNLYTEIYHGCDAGHSLLNLVNITHYGNHYEIDDPVIFDLYMDTTKETLNSSWNVNKPLVIPYRLGQPIINLANSTRGYGKMIINLIHIPNTIITLNRLFNSESIQETDDDLHLVAEIWHWDTSVDKYVTQGQYINLGLDSALIAGYSTEHGYHYQTS